MRNSIPSQPEEKRRHPVLGFILSTFMVVVAVIWFIKGAVVLPNKDVFLYGTHARAVAVIVFLFGVWPLFQSIFRRLKK